MMVIPETRHAH